MKNAETPAVKVVLYGAMSSLGSALMAELLRRQHEVIAILDDLTALANVCYVHDEVPPHNLQSQKLPAKLACMLSDSGEF